MTAEGTLRRWLRRLLIISVVITALYATISLVPWSCGLCGEDAIAELASPEGRYLARAYIRNCGATTGYATHINLRRRWDYFNTNWPGTITQGEVMFNACWSKVSFVWTDDHNLTVQYEACTPRKDRTVFLRNADMTWNDVTITYIEVPRAPGVAEQVEVRGVYLKGNEEVGGFSDVGQVFIAA